MNVRIQKNHFQFNCDYIFLSYRIVIVYLLKYNFFINLDMNQIRYYFCPYIKRDM